ncbi:MAG: hypothetical protein FJ146_05470 [Deltaproteobacteria bacterium]|nr:hypothetical protein [Deltaproteobacteria bacterium]
MFRYAIILAVSATASQVALATGAEIPAEAAFHVLADINSPSPMQPASCHGSFGIDLGVGMEYFALPTSSSLLLEQVGLAYATQDGDVRPMATPRMWLTKGFTLPLDFSVSIAAPGRSQDLLQVSGILQWTLYQSLGRPALALRASYGQLQGHYGTKLSSTSGEGIVSYGFWRYLTVYGRAGFSSHRGSIFESPVTTDQLGFNESLASTSYELTHLKGDTAAGLKVNLWSPFAALSGEANFNSSRSYTVKLSYLL